MKTLGLVLALLVVAPTFGAKSGGTFYLNLGGEPEKLHPITAGDYYATQVQGYVLESLATRDDETYDWQPALAESWEISKDGLTFTFKLRKGVKFHDGTPLTIEDVKFSFDAIFIEEFHAANLIPFYEKISKAEIVDADHIKFTAKEKYFKNFDVLAGLTVFPKKVYGNPKDEPKQTRILVGTGPYKLESFERGKKITLVKNPDWWGRNVPYFKDQYNMDSIVMRFIKEENVALERLKKGDIDFHEFLPEAFVQKATGPIFEGPSAKVIKVKTENKSPKDYRYIGWNELNPMFKDRDTRIALAHLMNREQMNEKFRFGMSMLAAGPWYRQSDEADQSIKPFGYDPKKASELLKKAGWADTDKDGLLDKVINGHKTPFSFTMIYSKQDYEKYFTMYKEDLRKAGIDMTIKLVEFNSLLKILDEGKFEAISLGWAGGSVEQDPKQIWHSSSAVTGGSNYIHYKNPEVDKLIDEARAILERAPRQKIMRKIYRLIAEDAPYLFLFNDKYILYGHTKKIAKEKDTYTYAVGTNHWWVQAAN